jgi:GST-like protein
MTNTLYGYPGSGSAAIEAALVLAGVPHRLVDAASRVSGPALDELRQRNPLAQIPTLRWADGSVMTESAAILIELGLRHPASGLLPDEPAARAQAIRGLVYIAANCYAAIGVIDFPDRVLAAPTSAESSRVQQRSRERLHQLWEVFADQFPLPAGQFFYGGDRPGALDLLASVVSRWSGTRPHLAAQRPAL